MKKSLALIIIIGAVLNAQDKPVKSASSGPLVHQFIELKNLQSGSQKRYDVKEQVKKLSGIEYVDNADLGVLAISGTPNQVKQAEQLFKRFDIAEQPGIPKQIQSTLVLLQASDEDGPEPPANLKSVVEQLKKTFSYQSYTVVDTILLQSSEGANLELRGILPVKSPNEPAPQYYINYQNVIYSPSTKSFTFRRFHFDLRGREVHSQIGADLLVREGQQLVIGKLNQQGTNKALFVVLSTSAN